MFARRVLSLVARTAPAVASRRAVSTVHRTASGVVEVRYKDLVESQQSLALAESIAEAYGPSGLGLLVVSGVPGFAEKRQRLLPLARKFAELPPDVLRSMEHAPSFYSFGWSHGKEKFNGVPDLGKGSFYANPQYNVPCEDPKLQQEFKEYCMPNIWPRQHLPQLEHEFRDLGQLIVSVGVLLAHHCDRYVTSKLGDAYREGLLQTVIASSLACKARLLHYFAMPAAEAQKAAMDSWCGWHLDHGSLTGLTPAMFLDAEGRQIPCPDPEAGLYIRDRAGKQHRVVFDASHVAFQIGESSQIHTGGLLRATPHCVRAAAAPGVTRETLAVFMQPTWDVPMTVPRGVDPASLGVTGFKMSQTFKTFSDEKFSEYY